MVGMCNVLSIYINYTFCFLACFKIISDTHRHISLHSLVYFSDDGLTSFAPVDQGQFVATIFNLLYSHVGLS